MGRRDIIKFFAIQATLILPGLYAGAAERVSSPDGNLCLTAEVKNGKAQYSLKRGDRTVLNPSRLGFILSDGPLCDCFRVLKTSHDSHDEVWTQPWGETESIRNNYNELTLRMQETKGAKRKLNVVFRVFNDGIGFRYEFPEQSGLNDFQIMDELTEFAMPSDAKAWSQPTNGTKYYEALYTCEPISRKDTVSTPMTIEVDDDLYMAIHEANLTDYASLNLTPRQSSDGLPVLTTALTPWQSGVKVYAKAPGVTPWRTVTVTNTPGGLITSYIALNLNEPCCMDDVSWIEPGRYVGIWWGMHMKDYTWEQGPQHGATTENTKRYIDFASKHGFKGVLVEGWNYGWDNDWTVNGHEFDFMKPYPDYDLEGLQNYALSKGVRLIAHNETGGAAENYENQLEDAFALYNRLGINCVKTGYVNPLLDNKELQHSQYGINHYRKVLEAAARHKIMVVNHEPAMPSGLRRTYPNMMAGEGMRGQEYNAWSPDGGNPPYHICILPFTRGLAGPMDFTPGIFNFENKAAPDTHPQTTIAKQLAEYVVIYSPLQMAADMIENYENHPALSFIESCPTNWQKTIVPVAEIGKHITIARKDRDSDNWFIGSVTDENPREISLPLDFLEHDASYRMTVYEDGPGADYRTDPYPLNIRQSNVTAQSEVKIRLAPGGGTAIRLIKL
ncbi:MAG: glycoside hydrolase family 97 protein [Muribaculaceae bacterium]|nr:glycoside hydrolase family 97 protein [Muribaculaceae bacterium]